MNRARHRESTAWISVKYSKALRTLLRWRGPMRCHSVSVGDGLCHAIEQGNTGRRFYSRDWAVVPAAMEQQKGSNVHLVQGEKIPYPSNVGNYSTS